MSWFRQFATRFVALFRKRQFEQEMNDELRAHLEMLIDENVLRGISREEARYAALREFGGVEQVKETYREQRGLVMFETLLQDVRFGSRMLAKNRGFTAIAALTLALGIGANTAIFSLIDAVLLRSLPVKNPAQLVLINTVGARGIPENFSYPAFKQLREHNQVTSGMFAFSGVGRLDASANGEADIATAQFFSGDYFSVLGVRAIVGRIFTAEDDKDPGANPIVVISYSYWNRRFALDPAVIGKGISINKTPFRIVGVTPPEFFGITVGSSPDISIPVMMQAPVHGRSLVDRGDVRWLKIMARMKPGVSEAQTQANLNVLFPQILAETWGQPKNQKEQQGLLESRIELTPASNGLSSLRLQFSKPLLILMIVVGLVLLIACANVANLSLARGRVRQKEIALRLALGGGRWRIIGQLLTESGMLATLGGALGLLLAFWGTDLLLSFLPRGPVPIFVDITPDWRVLGFAGAVSLLTGVLFGVVPALRSTRLDLTPALNENAISLGARGSSGGRSRLTFGKILVVSQVALSLLLLVGAGLFVRSLWNLKNLDAGFNPNNVWLFLVDPTLIGYKGAQIPNLYKELLERVNNIPGIQSASLSALSPMSRFQLKDIVSVVGYAPRPGQDMSVSINNVGPKYFQTVGTPLLMGRDFGPQDNDIGPKVALINETMAHYYFTNENPIGKRLGFPDRGQMPGEIVVIGVVKDSKYHELREQSQRMVYLPYLQVGLGDITFEVRTSGNLTGMLPQVRKALQSVDKDLPVFGVRLLAEQVDESLIQERLIATLSSFFGLLALLLACMGLYGTMSYAVTRRTNEIGIRMALGARQIDVLWMVLRETLILVLIGVAMGIPVALAATRLTSSLISGLLFGLKATDPVIIGLATLLMLAVALFAGYLPARRATKVDPMVALRYE